MPHPKARNVQAEVDLFRSVQAIDLWGTIASLVGGSAPAAAPAEDPGDRLQREMAERASQVLLDFCETYPACRVAPSAAALETLWGQCELLPAGPIADALCEQLGWMSNTEWQGRLRALHALEYFCGQGARGREIALAVSDQGSELLKALVEVPQCRDMAVDFLCGLDELVLDSGCLALPSSWGPWGSVAPPALMRSHARASSPAQPPGDTAAEAGAQCDLAPALAANPFAESPLGLPGAGESVLVRTDDGARWLAARVVAVFPWAAQAEGYSVPAGTVKVSYELGVKWVMPQQLHATLRPAPDSEELTRELSTETLLELAPEAPAAEAPDQPAKVCADEVCADAEALTREPSDETAASQEPASPEPVDERAPAWEPAASLPEPEPWAPTAPSAFMDALSTLGAKEQQAPSSVMDLVAMLGALPNVPKPAAPQQRVQDLSGPSNFALTLALSGVCAEPL